MDEFSLAEINTDVKRPLKFYFEIDQIGRAELGGADRPSGPSELVGNSRQGQARRAPKHIFDETAAVKTFRRLSPEPIRGAEEGTGRPDHPFLAGCRLAFRFTG
jgi:hypothetical protein